MSGEGSGETVDPFVAVLAAHEPAEWREVKAETYPGADDARYGRFCSCGHMLDASDMAGSIRAHVAAALRAAEDPS